MPSHRSLLLLFGAVLVSAVGALVGSPWVTGLGGAVVLGVLAVHPSVTGLAGPTRLLLWAGLALLAVAGLVELSGWTKAPADVDELIAWATDPARQRAGFVRQVVVASSLILGCACFGGAIARLPRDQLRRLGRAAPAAIVVTVVLALLGSGWAVLLGSPTNVAVAVLLVLGGYAWFLLRDGGRPRIAPIAAAVGGTLLAVAAWLAAGEAGRIRPEPDVHVARPMLAVAVRVEPAAGFAADIRPAATTAALLLAVALTVVATARLSAADRDVG